MTNESSQEITSSAGPIFVDIDADNPVTEIESLCMNCHEQGTTRLLLTKIPHFKEIIVMAFECPHCGLQNNEISSAEAVQERGLIVTCNIAKQEDLNRQIVKSEHATLKIPELEFEIEPTEKGSLTTVEGVLSRAIEGLEKDQPVRKAMDEELWSKIEAVIAQFKSFLSLEKPFHVTIDDPSGNSYIENLYAPLEDPQMAIRHYQRTLEQNNALGLAMADGTVNDQIIPVPADLDFDSLQATEATAKQLEEDETALPEVLHFPGNCSNCNAPAETRMHLVNIPYFKEVVIMSTSCDSCGFKSNEVKAGGAISQKGKRITLKVVDAEDMSRDILKSETCGFTIPEVDLRLTQGTLGGQFTTIEGLLKKVREELEEKTPFFTGDSASDERRQTFERFLAKMDKIIKLEVLPFTIILDDPMANSYLQNLYAPDPDPNLTIEEYERSWEENEVLGLNDIQTEGYEEQEEAEGEIEKLAE